jgi:hypothetical protein
MSVAKKFPQSVNYPSNEDIYNRDKKENVDPNDRSKSKGEDDELPDNDLDVPGAELDDADEKIGEEDEENNYYSLGGDDHNDLEEDKGD